MNLIGGWLTFAISAFVYLSTIPYTTSFWDCGEFIGPAYRMEVCHPPGSPLFLMMGRLFSMFAPTPADVATMVNIMSGLASAFTIMFLFWTITHLAKKLIDPDNSETVGKTLAIMGAGLTGALAYTFSDTFWFSAVEGEVYALSSLLQQSSLGNFKMGECCQRTVGKQMASPNRISHGAFNRCPPFKPVGNSRNCYGILFQKIRTQHQRSYWRTISIRCYPWSNNVRHNSIYCKNSIMV